MPEHEHGSRLKSFKNNGRDLDVSIILCIDNK